MGHQRWLSVSQASSCRRCKGCAFIAVTTRSHFHPSINSKDGLTSKARGLKQLPRDSVSSNTRTTLTGQAVRPLGRSRLTKPHVFRSSLCNINNAASSLGFTAVKPQCVQKMSLHSEKGLHFLIRSMNRYNSASPVHFRRQLWHNRPSVPNVFCCYCFGGTGV
jgi:hypothetical protein